MRLILALTLWYEAAGEPTAGKLAVASVILCRANGDVDRIEEICMAPKQFSCWNLRSMPPRIMEHHLALGTVAPDGHIKGPSIDAWRECLRIADAVFDRTFKPTIIATHYHATSVHPTWADSMRRLAKIGNHVYYIA